MEKTLQDFCPATSAQPDEVAHAEAESAAVPGSLSGEGDAAPDESGRTAFHWPLKLQLAPLDDPSLRGADLIISGDCTAFATSHYHERLRAGRVMLIGCPKFEDPRALTAKMTEIFKEAGPRSCMVARMEKPCCKGLVTVCRDAARAIGSDLEVREVVVYCSGVVEEK